MRWWRKLLTVLGLSNDARIHVRASDIEVTITGEPELVRQVLEVVRSEIERHQVKKRRATLAPGAMIPSGVPSPSMMAPPTDSLIVPAELDDMDSPYAIPEHRPADQQSQSESSDDTGSGRRDDLETEPTRVGEDGGGFDATTQPPFEDPPQRFGEEITSSSSRPESASRRPPGRPRSRR
ncbi:MAG: hypothetical protein HY791_11500 [Deltaproteobacteria bacterium]|nr:hypothetical protein [Deltaproteobacteria bacterium]